MVFITDSGLVNLKQYQYKSGGYSWLDNKINYFWVFCVELVPKWVAPNLLTFIGFVFMTSSTAISISYDYTLTETIPRWTFLYAAWSIFIYQTLDAIDGKQARRTNSSSPLGQLFDHGCDSFVMTFFLLQMAQASQMPKEPLFYVFLGIQIVLWGANQKEHHTGILHTHVFNFGVTEIELFCMGVQLITYFFGQEVWQSNVEACLPGISIILSFIPHSSKILRMPIYQFLYTIIVPCAYSAGAYTFATNLIYAKHKCRAILEWMQLVIIWGLQFIWFSQPLYGLMAGPILINFGVILSLIVCKLIICSTTKDTPALFHIEAIPFELSTLLIYFFQNILSEDMKILLFWANFIATVLLSFLFLKGVIQQITEYLGIYCFSILKRKDI